MTHGGGHASLAGGAPDDLRPLSTSEAGRDDSRRYDPLRAVLACACSRWILAAPLYIGGGQASPRRGQDLAAG